MDKKILLGLGAVLVFIITVNIMTRQYVGELKSAKPSVTGKLKEVPREGAAVAGAVLPADNKVRKGIVVVNRFNKPVTQGEWDKYMKDLVNSTGMLQTDEGREAMKKKALNPAQFEDTMRRLEEETKKVDEAYSKDPVDPMLQKRMEDLRKMKALTKVMAERGVVDPDAPDLPGMDSPKDALAVER